jgi:hypothetical protein
MSKWGVFDKVSPPHVMPVDADGFAIGGHAVSDQCWCRPTLHRGDAERDIQDVLVHQNKGRGGCDA